ncbi:response regulator [Variovorax sp. J31P179]|uniref:response regulator transcription factor n=1 Tax=Variovorax sp. J31P179 TaxID=3053508 RepID=UPI0025774CCE|nr:response regulator [Variovorax sp. J31P179]MDM0081138.1 response regulator [Variovorax sp. J31P179]
MSGAVVHVVDDDEQMRVALARLLRAEGYEVRSYESAGHFLLTPPDGRPGCVLLDLHLPGPSGLDLQQALQQHAIALPIVFLTGRGDIASSVRAMKAGAVDFLTKPVDPHTLLVAVDTALARDRSRRASLEHVQDFASRLARLSGRERSVFDQVVIGKLNKQIGDTLGISERTVKMHRAQVMAKMEVASIAELVHAAEILRSVGAPRSNDA